MMCTVGIPSALVLERCVNPWPSKHSHLYQEASEYLKKYISQNPVQPVQPCFQWQEGVVRARMRGQWACRGIRVAGSSPMRGGAGAKTRGCQPPDGRTGNLRIIRL